MIRRIRFVMPYMLLALLGMPAAQLQAQQQPKTVAVMSVSSVDGILDNINYLTEAAGSGDMGQMVTMMSSAYLEGIDRGNPIGMVLHTDGQEFVPMGFIPVKDLDKVFSVLEDSVGSPRDAGNGIKEIPGLTSMFIKEQGGYAFVGQTIESMANLPANPVADLGNLPKEYDLALRGYIQNVPEAYLQMAIQALQQGVKQGIDQLPEEDQDQQRQLIEAQLQQMETAIKESDQLTIGWKTEPENKRTFIDVAFSAIPGGELAKQMNSMADAKSDYTGFVLPGAAMTMSFASQVPPEQLETSKEAIEGMKAAILKEIARDESDNDDARKIASEVIEQAIDIFVDTLASGKMDAAVSVLADSGDLQLYGGFHVAKGQDVEDMLRRVAKAAEGEKDFPGINFNAGSADGVTYHTMAMDIPDDEEDARKILGDKMEMVVGIGETSAYIGFGENCMSKLKQIIGSQPKQQSVKPFDMMVALSPIMEFISGIEDNPMIGSISEVLEQDDKDHIRVSVQPVQNGFKYRIELEEGILRAIGAGIKMSGAGGF